MKTATTTTNAALNTSLTVTDIACQSDKVETKSLSADKGPQTLTIGGITITGNDVQDLSSQLLELMGAVDVLGYPLNAAMAIINGLKDGLKIGSPAIITALGEPTYKGEKINTQTKGGIGQRVSRLAAFINGFKAIGNPFTLLADCTDYNEGAQILTDYMALQKVAFMAEKRQFVEIREEQEAGQKDSLPADKGDESDESEAMQVEVLTKAVDSAINAPDLVTMLVNGYVATSTSDKAYKLAELKAVCAENDKLIADLIAKLQVAQATQAA